MICNDCLHRRVCTYWCTGIDIMPDKNIEVRCPNFADKSLFVELPCKVGDDIYWITEDRKIRMNKVFSIKLENEDEHFICFIKSRVFNQICMFKTFVFGRTCFLTKEAAEKALKERENG